MAQMCLYDLVRKNLNQELSRIQVFFYGGQLDDRKCVEETLEDIKISNHTNLLIPIFCKPRLSESWTKIFVTMTMTFFVQQKKTAGPNRLDQVKNSIEEK